MNIVSAYKNNLHVAQKTLKVAAFRSAPAKIFFKDVRGSNPVNLRT